MLRNFKLTICIALTAAVVGLFAHSVAQDTLLAVDDSATRQITAVLTTQAECWNAGDIDGFMEYYWKSDDLTLSSGGTMRRGWDETNARYRKRYPTPERMGKLTFLKLEIRLLGETAALVLGEWRLVREADPIGGNFTLVMQRHADDWVITHDHTSQLEDA